MMQLFTSVIIPSFGSERTLPSTVESVLKWRDANVEIIIVDDASEKKVEDYITVNPGIKIIRNDTRQGPAYCRNAGARISKGDVLLFLDSDVYISPNAISVIHDAFKEKGMSILVGLYDPACLYQDFFSNYYNLRRIKASLDQGPDLGHGAMYAVKKDIFTQAGGYDTKYTRPSVEDTEFGIRLFSLGYEARVLNGFSGVHDKRMTFVSLLKNDFIRSADKVEFILSLKKIKDIVRHGRFNQCSLEQLLPVFLIPFFWLSVALGFANHHYFYLALLFVLLFMYLNRVQFLFACQRKGLLFYLKSILYYPVDLSVIFMGIMAGFIFNLAKGRP